MLSFRCDYAEGAHPDILRKLHETNFEQLDGYGSDPYTQRARNAILAACACPDGEVFLIGGGTQTNATVIAALLGQGEGVIAVETGHIGVHEAGAIEYTGHKVLTLPSHDGKMDPEELEAYLVAFEEDASRDHMVQPALVYLSLPTEYGTVYTRAEMLAIRRVAHAHGLRLYVDGARLGYALASPATDFGMKDLKDLCDVFYIGGTKVGALCGEAVVFPDKAPRHFFTIVKQHGALLAKGRLLGIQFDVLFSDGLYARISENAIARARELVELLKRKGIPFYLESPTNQQFVILGDREIERLSPLVAFDLWQRYDSGHMVVRFATSWATGPEQIRQLEAIL